VIGTVNHACGEQDNAEVVRVTVDIVGRLEVGMRDEVGYITREALGRSVCRN